MRKVSGKLVAVAVVVTIVLGGVLLIRFTTPSHVETPNLGVADLARTPPAAEDRELHLIAGGVDSCLTGRDQVEDVEVDETGGEIVVRASIRIGDTLWSCEVRSARVTFVVSLDRPLGDRAVIDDSGGRRTVIWSPALREGLQRGAELTDDDAERYFRSEFPGETVNCTRPNFQYFECVDHSPGGPEFIYLKVLRTGELAVGP